MAITKYPPDLTGFVFSRLIVLEPYGRQRWRCRCECGNETIVMRGSLITAHTRSCGCLMREATITRLTKHGARADAQYSAEYGAWQAMRDRCRNPHYHGFARYGGRGIFVCEMWNDFGQFLSDVGPRPSAAHTLDRYPNRDGNYEPGNVRWATMAQQGRNTARTRFITYDNITLCLTDWAQRVGLKRATLSDRLRTGWTVERALTTPALNAHGAPPKPRRV
jgi:hypothetical protein